MICHKNKIIFIHIPKCAGVSISTAFGYNTNLASGRHYTSKEYKEKYPYEYKTYYKFAFVRNPYSRILSFYNYILSLGRTNKPFNEWVYNMDGEPEYLFSPMKHWVDEGTEIYRFEQIGDEFGRLNKTLNININFPYHNSTNSVYKNESYNEDSINFIKNKYKDDFILFNYKDIFNVS